MNNIYIFYIERLNHPTLFSLVTIIIMAIRFDILYYCHLHLILNILLAVPVNLQTAVPVNFQAAVGKREVSFSWSPSSGSVSIIGYIVTCTPSPATLPQSFPQSGAHRVSGFSPQTSYNCSVAAYTSQTVGPPANVMFTTEEDSKSL